MGATRRETLPCLALAAPLLALTCHAAWAGEIRGVIVDRENGALVPARLYIANSAGELFHAESADSAGSAVPYHRQRSDQSVETHTTLSAHRFKVELPPGVYTLTAERGKEYLPQTQTARVDAGAAEVEIGLQRWANMAEQGWYSGDTHVHRSVEELPNVLLAEDLNVAFPLTNWVTAAYTPPSRGDKNSPPVEPRLVEVDATHVFYPLNTEYEIFTVDGERHPLGAIFGLNHRNLLPHGAPPVRAIAEQVHREGGLLELDKHNWPWSMMLVPIMEVDLYELTNNHLWRAPFHFTGWGEQPAEYMNIEQREDGFTEAGWIDFTFENYYALLNSGYRLRPTAGTASGVHPVPLGFGRVYVYLGDEFSYDRWIAGLNEGRSFVTTGPMMDVRLNGELPGATFRESGDKAFRLKGTVRSANLLTRIEVVAAGKVVSTLNPQNRRNEAGAYLTEIDERLSFPSSSWLAVRCFESRDGRLQFAHSGPFHIEVEGKPLRPRREQVDYLVQRVEDQIERNRGVLSEAALAEYRSALEAYRGLEVAPE